MSEINRETTLAFTGHRPHKIGGYDENHPTRVRVRAALTVGIERAVQRGFVTFIAGGAQGVDMDAALICLKMGLTLISALPFLGQEARWSAQSQRQYREILKHSKVIYVSEGGWRSPADNPKYSKRDRWMVDHSSVLIACWNGTSGGTATTVAYAQTQPVKIWRINPTV